MNRNFTTNHLIRYAYNETDLSGTTFIQKKIDSSAAVAAEYSEILQVLGFLDSVALEPSEKSLTRILHHLHEPGDLVPTA